MKQEQWILLGLTVSGVLILFSIAIKCIKLTFEILTEFLKTSDTDVMFSIAEKWKEGNYVMISGVFNELTKQIKQTKKYKGKEVDTTIKGYHSNGSKKLKIYD